MGNFEKKIKAQINQFKNSTQNWKKKYLEQFTKGNDKRFCALTAKTIRTSEKK